MPPLLTILLGTRLGRRMEPFAAFAVGKITQNRVVLVKPYLLDVISMARR